MDSHHQINYVEFPSKDLTLTQEFFTKVFGWEFQGYGPDYMAFSKAGLEGGFFRSEQCSSTKTGSALIVISSEDLEKTQAQVEEAGGIIVTPIFHFPGGRRFHFTEPGGNELGVWSKKGI